MNCFAEVQSQEPQTWTLLSLSIARPLWNHFCGVGRKLPHDFSALKRLPVRVSPSSNVPTRSVCHEPPCRTGCEIGGIFVKTRNCPPLKYSFFESPQGLELLHRLLVAIHLVFGQAHDGGIRGICWFLELSQLDRFVAPSYGSQQKVASLVEKLIGQFGHDEDLRLAQQMPHRDISLCEDETFHPQICLVAIEPVSNFLILEAYAENREAATWNAAVDVALEPFSVTVTQCVSDQAAALLSHAQSHLGVHHSPDVFHVQYEISKATSLALNRQTEKAQNEFDQAKLEHQENIDKRKAFDQQWPSSLRKLDQEKRLIQQAPDLEKKLERASQRFEETRQRQRRARDARCGISQDYHPFDLNTGEPMESSQVKERLEEHFKTLHAIADEAKLSQGADDRIAKAQRVMPSMIATIVFFWTMIELIVKRLDCGAEAMSIWKNELVAGYYIACVAQRCSVSGEAKRLTELSESILARARSPDRPLGQLSDSVRLELEQQAHQAANIFQRSSSCVEGRNGQLSLRHHGLRELTPSKLQALRVIHNYVIRRPDGTTAAQRFFGNKPRALFEWLLKQLPMPARPRQTRTRPQAA